MTRRALPGRWWPRSLAARILLVQGVAVVLLALTLPVVGASVLRHSETTAQRRVILAQAMAIARGVRHDATGWHVALPDVLAHIFASPYDGRSFAVVDRQHRILVQSRFAATVPWRRIRLTRDVGRFALLPVSGITLPLRLPDRRAWVLVAQDANGPGVIVDEVVETSLARLALVLLAMLLALALVSALVVRRLVVAVRQVSERAMLIGPRTLDVRLDETGLPSEVKPLVHATNELVARLEESVNGSAQFVANIVHELRTPLSTLKLRLEGVADAPVRASLVAQVDRLGHVIAQLHDLASLEQLARGEQATFDLGALAAEVVADWAPAVFDGDHSIAFEPAGVAVPVVGNRILAGLAIANLVSNAIRHTPAGTAIMVRVDRAAAVIVADDGPGITQYEPDQLTRRFWRADHRRSDSAGLGLSIVRRIMDVHTGTLTIGDRPGGGAAFALHFPHGPADAAANAAVAGTGSSPRPLP